MKIDHAHSPYGCHSDENRNPVTSNSMSGMLTPLDSDFRRNDILWNSGLGK